MRGKYKVPKANNPRVEDCFSTKGVGVLFEKFLSFSLIGAHSRYALLVNVLNPIHQFRGNGITLTSHVIGYEIAISKTIVQEC